MAILRTKNEEGLNNYNKRYCERPDEWKEKAHVDRLEQNSWKIRYDSESNMVLDVCLKNNYTKVLEFGSGPGVLGNMVVDKSGIDIDWTNIDKIGAKQEFEKRGYKGKFLVENLHNYFDIKNVDRDYDLIVANDFLEHIANPSNILSMSYDITKESAKIFVSVPNWRMGHTFIYRGLFDYDNWIYFMWTHGWKVTEVLPSSMNKTLDYPRLSSEEEMPEELRLSWNWYFIGEKRQF